MSEPANNPAHVPDRPITRRFVRRQDVEVFAHAGTATALAIAELAREQRIDPHKLIENCLNDARGVAVRDYMKTGDAEALARAQEFQEAMRDKAAELIRNPRR